jgi:osmotically inducible protein OsmC
MAFERKASARWNGGLKKGNGTISTSSGALKGVPYSFGRRFDNDPGTNPEELIGGAHAGCFSMAFSGQLEGAGHTPERIDTKANVTLEKQDVGWTVTKVHLDVTANVPGIDEAEFQKIAEAAKKGCPISRLLDAEITVKATLTRTQTTSTTN